MHVLSCSMAPVYPAEPTAPAQPATAMNASEPSHQPFPQSSAPPLPTCTGYVSDGPFKTYHMHRVDSGGVGQPHVRLFWVQDEANVSTLAVAVSTCWLQAAACLFMKMSMCKGLCKQAMGYNMCTWSPWSNFSPLPTICNAWCSFETMPISLPLMY